MNLKTKTDGFVKFRFGAHDGATAGLVIDTARWHSSSAADLSRMFPVSEARYMVRIDVSPVYDTWEAAFNHTFH